MNLKVADKTNTKRSDRVIVIFEDPHYLLYLTNHYRSWPLLWVKNPRTT